MKKEYKSGTEEHMEDDDCPICQLMKTGEDNDPRKLSEAFIKAAQNPDAVVGINPDILKGD